MASTQHTEPSLKTFIADFEAVHREHFTNDHTPQPTVSQALPNGIWYISKRGVHNPFPFYYVQRQWAGDRAIEETALVYPKEGGPMAPFQSEEVGEWYVTSYRKE